MLFFHFLILIINQACYRHIKEKYEFYISSKNDIRTTEYFTHIISYLYMKNWNLNKKEILKRIEEMKYIIIYKGIKSGSIFNELYYELSKIQDDYFKKYFPDLSLIERKNVGEICTKNLNRISKMLYKYESGQSLHKNMKKYINPVNILTNRSQMFENIFYFKYYEYMKSLRSIQRKFLSKNMIYEHYCHIDDEINKNSKIKIFPYIPDTAIVHIDNFNEKKIDSLIEHIKNQVEKIKNKEIFLHIVIHVEQYILDLARREIKRQKPFSVDYFNFFRNQMFLFLYESSDKIHTRSTIVDRYENAHIKFYNIFSSEMVVRYIRGYEFFKNDGTYPSRENNDYLENILKNTSDDLYIKIIHHVSKRFKLRYF